MCDDVLIGSEPDPDEQNDRRKRSFDPTELTWNIDRLDERSLPLDGQFCPAADGNSITMHMQYHYKPFKFLYK